jgi:hypothetical protein
LLIFTATFPRKTSAMAKCGKIFILVFILGHHSFFTAHSIGQDMTDVALHFQPEHGFFNQEIKLSITAEANNATIYYTLNGSEPASTITQRTLLYQMPLVIKKTSCVRAVAILPDGSKSEMKTQTYIFIDDVIQQDYQATINAGLPQRWGRVTPDYGMDPDIVNDPRYGPLMKESLSGFDRHQELYRLSDRVNVGR